MAKRPLGTGEKAGATKRSAIAKKRESVPDDRHLPASTDEQSPRRSSCRSQCAGNVPGPEAAGPVAVRNPYEWFNPGAVPFSGRRARQAEKMAAWDMTEEQIAEAFGLSPEGWKVWKNFPAFTRALARGQQVAKEGTGREPGWGLDALRLSLVLKRQRRRARGLILTPLGKGPFLRSGGWGSSSRRTSKIIRMAAAAGLLGTSLMISTKSRGR